MPSKKSLHGDIPGHALRYLIRQPGVRTFVWSESLDAYVLAAKASVTDVIDDDAEYSVTTWPELPDELYLD